MSTGSIQLFVGPASACLVEQMKVRSSTRATSSGSEAHQKELGLPVRRTNVPLSTNCVVSRSHSALDPSHHTTSSGPVRLPTCATHETISGCVVGVVPSPPAVGLALHFPPHPSPPF